MPSYQFWTEQARRWSEDVEYASPMTAWTQEMYDILRESGGDTLVALDELRRRRAERRRTALHP